MRKLDASWAIKRAASAKDQDALEKWAQLYRIDIDKQSTPDLRDNICCAPMLFRCHWRWRRQQSSQAGARRGLPCREMRFSGNGHGKNRQGSNRCRPAMTGPLCAAFPICLGQSGPTCTILTHIRATVICAGTGHCWLTEMSVVRASRWPETWIAMPKSVWNMSTTAHHHPGE